jgi:hypothetical protein
VPPKPRRAPDRIWDVIAKASICMMTTRFSGGLRARPLEARHSWLSEKRESRIDVPLHSSNGLLTAAANHLTAPKQSPLVDLERRHLWLSRWPSEKNAAHGTSLSAACFPSSQSGEMDLGPVPSSSPYLGQMRRLQHRA